MEQRLKSIFFLLPSIVLLFSAGCSFIDEYLHMQPVQILDFYPHQENIDSREVFFFSVTFSDQMNRPLTEEAFSLSGDTETLQGHFEWDNGSRVLRFKPEAPLQAKCSFTLSVASAAEDIYGNSLNRPFSYVFYTGSERNKPSVLAFSPTDGSVAVSQRQEVSVLFSEPVDKASFYSGFSIAPAVEGGFGWYGEGEEVVFTPLQDYMQGQLYSVTLSQEITDSSGNPLVEEVGFCFEVDRQPELSVISVTTAAEGKPLQAISKGGGLDPSLGIEKDEQFVLSFSSQVPATRRTEAVDVEPVTPFTLLWDDQHSSCTLTFAEHLEWNRIYRLAILDETYIFLVNGQCSMPITVEALRYSADIKAPAGPGKYTTLEYANTYSFTDAVSPVFDFHLHHSGQASIDLGSFLQALSISISHSCLSISTIDVDVSPLPGPEQSVVRLYCNIQDDPAAAGTITFRLDDGLRDDLGNRLTEGFTLLINN